MNRIFLIVYFIFCITIGIQAQHTYALVVGLSNYKDEGLQLRQTTKDAKAIAKIFEAQNSHVTLLTSKYATQKKIIEELHKICEKATENDRIIFYFSGHGAKGSLLAYDGTDGRKFLSYRSLMREFSDTDAQIICFIDACHSGTIKAALPSKGDKLRQHIVLFLSSRDDETSTESPNVGAGYFTIALAKGLKGKGDNNIDRKISVMELFKYIYGDVKLRSNDTQHPQLICPTTLYDTTITHWD